MIRRAAGLAGLLCAVGFLIWAFASHWQAIQATEWHIDAGLLALSLAGITFLFFLDALGWHLTLRALGQHLPIRQSIRIWLLSSLARYLPGGVWPYASRVAMATTAGIGLAPAAVSLYLETLLLMSSSLAIGLPALFGAAGAPMPPALALVLWLVLGLLLHPRALKLLHLMPGRVGHALRQTALPSGRMAMALYAYYLLFWVLFGSVFLLFVAAFHPIASLELITAMSAMPMAFFLGFVVFFVPGGIGVREGALYVLLLTTLPPATSLAVAAASRLWIMAGEMLSLAVVLGSGLRRPNANPPG